MENIQQKQNKRWWKFEKLSRKNYGHIALIGLLAVLVKSAGLQIGSLLLIALLDILILIGVICGIVWWIKTRELKQNN